MIKVKLSDIVNSVEGIKALLDTKLPIKTAYWISKLVNSQIERELKIYNEQREKLVIEFGTKSDDGTTQVKDPKDLKKFMEKLNLLLDLEVELKWDPINIEDLGDVKIEPRHLPGWLFV